MSQRSAKPPGDGRVVGGDDERGAGVVRGGEEHVDDGGAAGAVELAGRLVGQDQARLAGERARDRDRWAWPPESSSGSLSRNSPRSSRSSASRAAHAPRRRRGRRGRAAARRSPRRQRRAAGSGPGRRPRPGRAAAPRWRRSRASCTVPTVGRSRPASRCSSVDLPEPDGPISAMRARGLDLAVGRPQRDRRGRARCRRCARRRCSTTSGLRSWLDTCPSRSRISRSAAPGDLRRCG